MANNTNKTSTSSIETQRMLRIERMHKLMDLGVSPYPVYSNRDFVLKQVKIDFEKLSEEYSFGSNKQIALCGRVKSKRGGGKISFATVEDESMPTGFQFVFKVDLLPNQTTQESLTFDNFKELIDEGDYIEAIGYLEASSTGEPSLFVQKFRILTKSIRPLPDKLEYDNTEARYLDRVADFKMDTKDDNGISIRDVIRFKALHWKIWREELDKEGFLEVECPIFENTPGGADARPFKTFYNELDQEMYMRISLELPLKKLIAGGFEKVYEIGTIFRNEGASPQHLQEYTQIEWYWAYSDYFKAMPFIQRVFRRIVKEILGTYIQTDYYGNEINWGEWITQEESQKEGWQSIGGWPMMPYFEAVRYYSRNFYEGGEIDLENKTYEELLDIAAKNGVEIEKGTGLAGVMDKIYKKVCRAYITNPIFLMAQPADLEPLAKRDPNDPTLVHRCQIVVGTAEMGKFFSELNDPIDQLERFEVQQAARDAGDEEAQFMNTDYVKAMEYGMPPMSGFGYSERMVSFLLGKPIKECTTFPHIRNSDNNGKDKKERTMAGHAVILNTPQISIVDKISAAAKISVSLGDVEIEPVIKQAENEQLILDLKKVAEAKGLIVNSSLKNNTCIGLMIFGRKNLVEEVTDGFSKFVDSKGEFTASSSAPSQKPTIEDLSDNMNKIDPEEIVNYFGNNTICQYWLDTYKFESSAKVLELGQNENGKYMVLNKTIFYPQGGGQPSDTGSIQESKTKVQVAIVHKCVKVDGLIYHYYIPALEDESVMSQILKVGDEVVTIVNREKRVRHAQLHSAAHLLDLAATELMPNLEATKGYSFPEGPYVEYNGVIDNTGEFAAALEKKVNQLLADSLPFIAVYTKGENGGIVRNMTIGGVETIRNTCPCGGTHVKNSSEIKGKIIIRGITSKKGAVRVKYDVVEE
jgi:lysyl-tRNA synthetase, class II